MSQLINHWPQHWYSLDGNTRCMATGCFYTTRAASLPQQTRDLIEHSRIQIGWEHAVLVHMLHQVQCVHNGCSYKRPNNDPSHAPNLFHHETQTHNGATSMSQVNSFVTLVRQGRVKMDKLNVVKMDIFDRMVDKLHLTGNTIVLIYRMGGSPDPDDQHYETLKKILSPSSLRPGGEREVPHWEPLPSTAFLMNIRPNVNALPDDLWRVLWTQLRRMYGGGRI